MNYLAALARCEGGWRLTVYRRSTRQRIAVVEGGAEYVRVALFVLRLATAPIAPFTEYGYRTRLAFVGGKPANGRP